MQSSLSEFRRIKSRSLGFSVLAILFLVVVFTCCPSGLIAQTQNADDLFAKVTPESVGLDEEKLAQLDELFSGDVEEGDLVGCMALVARGDKVAYLKTFGDRDRERELPMTEDTIFRIYSMSKPITSVAVMTLVEDGKIELDAPVAKYLPEMANVKVLEIDDEGTSKEVDPVRPMTVRDLLRHSSGLTYGFFGDSDVDKQYRSAGLLVRNPNLEDFVTKLSEIPLLHQPGSQFHYSVSTDVLGRIVEVASEKSFKDYLNERIFEPLGMNDTFFTVPKDKQSRFAQMYSRNDDGTYRTANMMSSYRFLNDNEFYSGGGGLCSTTYDYYRFCQMMVNFGELDGERILKEATVEEMIENQLGDLTSASRGFQFGLGVSIDGQGRYGWGGAAGTRFWIDPETKVIGIFMVQINPYRGGNYEAAMKRIVYGALED